MNWIPLTTRGRASHVLIVNLKHVHTIEDIDPGRRPKGSRLYFLVSGKAPLEVREPALEILRMADETRAERAVRRRRNPV
jgi:hypothetical protein